jgi:hypothetical protein
MTPWRARETGSEAGMEQLSWELAPTLESGLGLVVIYVR